MHDVMVKAQKVELKLKKSPTSATRARATTTYTAGTTIVNTSLGPLVYWNCKEPSHSKVNCPEPNIVLGVTSGDEAPPELQKIKKK